MKKKIALKTQKLSLRKIKIHTVQGFRTIGFLNDISLTEIIFLGKNII